VSSNLKVVPITLNQEPIERKGAEVRCEYGGSGSKGTHMKLVEALNAMIRDNAEITVKDVCLRAGLSLGSDNGVRKRYPEVHNLILKEIERQSLEMRQDERKRLLSALERLRNNNPIHTNPVPPGGYISIKKLMHESGVHESTINRHHKNISNECTENKRINTGDVWFFNDDDLELKGGSDAIKLNFSEIKPDWLKRSAKEFIKTCHATKSSATLVANVQAIKMFSHEIAKVHSDVRPADVDRAFIEKVLYQWSKRKLKPASVKRRLASLRHYFEWCEDSGSIEFGNVRLIRDSDYPRSEGRLPKFIPEMVMTKLNQHIDSLHPHVMRFFLVLQEVGLRISECCAMPFNCIYPDDQGDFFIKYYQFKMKKDHVVPISKELAAVIQEQQQAVRDEFGSKHELLFPTPKMQVCGKRAYPRAGLAWSKGTLIKNLNMLAKEFNITGPDSSIYNFSFHKFRHTTATRMINNGVPQYIVQRYLGHETPTMTSTYAHIMDETLKREFAAFQGKMVDINGKIYEPEEVAATLIEGSDPDGIDVQWLKKNIAVQSLPNGLCSLPVVQGSCPHANACLSCPNFRTDHRYLPQHRDQLAKTEKIIATCKANGWQRQLEMNESVKSSLIKIIDPLEAANHAS
jgi:integrase/recombinase XerD